MKYGHPAECICKRHEGRWKERRKRDEKEKEKEWGVHPMIINREMISEMIIHIVVIID